MIHYGFITFQEVVCFIQAKDPRHKRFLIQYNSQKHHIHIKYTGIYYSHNFPMYIIKKETLLNEIVI